MHLTEGLGIAYHFVKLTTGTVKIEDFDYTKDIYGYISVPGVFPFQDNLPRRLSSIGGDNIKLNEFSETNAVLYLKETMGDKKLSLDQWLKKIINDEEYRFSKLKLLRAKAIKPKNPNWEIVNVTTKGKLIV